MVKRLSLFCVTACLLVCATIASAQQCSPPSSPALVDGVGMDRASAMKDAQRMAVEQAVGTLVKSETLVENFQVVKDQIYTKSEGYAQLMQVVSEGESGGFYKIKAQFCVKMAELKNDLEALFAAKRFPRIMVVIPETHIGRKVPDPAGETEIIRKLLEKEFKVVDQKQIALIRENEQVMAAVEGDTKQAVLLGKKYGAEVIIIGEAFSEYNTEMGGMKSCRARVEGRAINVDTGEIIATNGMEASGVDVSENVAGKVALRNAGGKLADYLIDQILSRWTKDVTKGQAVTIVGTVASFGQWKALKDLLGTVSGVQGIDQRDFTNNQGELELRLQGMDAQDLADHLEGKQIKGGTIYVKKVTANRIDLKVK